MQNQSDTVIISKEQAGIRLDKVLKDHFPDQSRSYFQYLIANGLVLLNERSVKKREIAKVGDEVTIYFALTPEIKLEPENIPLKIIYEDDYLVAVDKPPGMVIHPAPGNWSGTFVNALLHHCKKVADIDSDLRPGIVHRLDKETSGVLLAAKDSKTQRLLIEQFASRKVKKQYIAICIGNPGNITIDEPIGRNRRNRKLLIVKEDGKPAQTICTSLFHTNVLSLVLLQPITGRTHQLRVHLKHKGFPILGDSTYGNTHLNKKYGAARQMLHAHSLKLKHPTTKESLDLKADIPDDMKKIFGDIDEIVNSAS